MMVCWILLFFTSLLRDKGKEVKGVAFCDENKKTGAA